MCSEKDQHDSLPHPAHSGAEVEWNAILNSKFKYGPDLLYEDASKMQFTAFRTLRPPMPNMHNVLRDPPMVYVA